MRVVLAGAFGRLGSEILKSLVNNGHYVVALDMNSREISGLDNSKYEFVKIDVTNPKTLEGTCKDCDVVISTVGLTTASANLSNYDIDYQGNLNLLKEAKASGVKQFVYTSVIRADEAPDVPMVNAKYQFELELKKSGLKYVILRPTGYFYDIVKVFKPMIEAGSVSLLGKKDYKCNVVKTSDFADFIVLHMNDDNKLYNIGGKEAYTYKEIANMCFEAAGKKPVIKHAPKFLFSILANLPKNKKNGKWAVIRFSKFTLTNDMIGDTVVGDSSFKEFIFESFKK